jgi:proline iminopeptidase
MLGLRMAVDGKRLEDTHRVVFWDQRGSGLSQRHDADEFDIGVYDQDLNWLVDHFSPGRPVILVGHSWGGMYATDYISKHPTKVAGAVLIEPGPLTGELFEDVKQDIVNFDFFSEWLNDFTWAHAVLSPDDHARADFLRLVGMLSHDMQPDIGDTETPLFWREGAVANAAMQADGMKDGKGAWDFTTGLDDFTRPVLFLASERNAIMGEQFQRRQLGFYPNAELTVIRNSGHEVPTTQPEQTLRVIFNYLGENNL